jgi:hypothetical protein
MDKEKCSGEGNSGECEKNMNRSTLPFAAVEELCSGDRGAYNVGWPGANSFGALHRSPLSPKAFGGSSNRSISIH